MDNKTRTFYKNKSRFYSFLSFILEIELSLRQQKDVSKTKLFGLELQLQELRWVWDRVEDPSRVKRASDFLSHEDNLIGPIFKHFQWLSWFFIFVCLNHLTLLQSFPLRITILINEVFLPNIWKKVSAMHCLHTKRAAISKTNLADYNSQKCIILCNRYISLLMWRPKYCNTHDNPRIARISCGTLQRLFLALWSE